MYRTRDLVTLAQKGIPEKYRVEVWSVYSGTGEVVYLDIYNIIIRTVHVRMYIISVCSPHFLNTCRWIVP